MPQVIACITSILIGLYGVYENFFDALIGGYAEIIVCAPIMTAWAMWLGRKYAEPGPIYIPKISWLPWISVTISLSAITLDASWIASYTIAPATLILFHRFFPSLATGRVLLLFFMAPTSYLLDLHFGELLQVSTAAATSWFTQLFDADLAIRTDNQLWCAPHKIYVTAECSGARLAVRFVALAVFVGSLKRSHPKIIAWLIAASLGLSIVTNIGRISVLCFAAPSYAANDQLGMENYHDTSGIAAFFIAYVILAFVNSRLVAKYFDTDKIAH